MTAQMANASRTTERVLLEMNVIPIVLVKNAKTFVIVIVWQMKMVTVVIF
jgi:hypothetical protein